MLTMRYLLAFPVLILPGAASAFQEELIFPLEQMHNHSPSLVETPEGDLIAAWFHGRGEKSDDTLVIQGARKNQGSDAWSAPFVLADNQDLPDQNPVLFIDHKNVLWLFWISSLDNTSQTYLLKYRTSTDYEGDGAPVWNWQSEIVPRPANFEAKVQEVVGEALKTEVGQEFADRLQRYLKLLEVKLHSRLGWMTRNTPIQIGEKMLVGVYTDTFGASGALWTEDGGKTWGYGEPIIGFGNVQPALVQKKDGTVVAMMRDNGAPKQIRIAESADQGQTWSPVKEMAIPNPGSSVAVTALENGNWILICNDTKGGARNGRIRLSAYLSDDEGATWKWHRVIEEHEVDPAAAYPNVYQLSDGLIHVVYTYTPEPNETIKHVWFDEAWVRESDGT